MAGFSERVPESLEQKAQIVIQTHIRGFVKYVPMYESGSIFQKKQKTGELFISFLYIALIYIQDEIYKQELNFKQYSK